MRITGITANDLQDIAARGDADPIVIKEICRLAMIGLLASPRANPLYPSVIQVDQYVEVDWASASYTATSLRAEVRLKTSGWADVRTLWDEKHGARIWINARQIVGCPGGPK